MICKVILFTVCVRVTSRVTSCFAMALSTVSYICVFWIPSPQKIANASRNCSSFLLKAFTLPEASSILFTNWHAPTWTQKRPKPGFIYAASSLHYTLNALYQSLELHRFGQNWPTDVNLSRMINRLLICPRSSHTLVPHLICLISFWQ